MCFNFDKDNRLFNNPAHAKDSHSNLVQFHVYVTEGEVVKRYKDTQRAHSELVEDISKFHESSKYVMRVSGLFNKMLGVASLSSGLLLDQRFLIFHDCCKFC